MKYTNGLSLCIQGTYNIYILMHEYLRFIPVYTGNIAPYYFGDNYQDGLSLCIQGTYNRNRLI